MAKYRKKPVVIDAFQYNGSVSKVVDFIMLNSNPTNVLSGIVRVEDEDLFINTLEGKMKVNIGDYIIKGVKGEYYPCKPDIFDETYELIE